MCFHDEIALRHAEGGSGSSFNPRKKRHASESALRPRDQHVRVAKPDHLAQRTDVLRSVRQIMGRVNIFFTAAIQNAGRQPSLDTLRQELCHTHKMAPRARCSEYKNASGPEHTKNLREGERWMLQMLNDDVRRYQIEDAVGKGQAFDDPHGSSLDRSMPGHSLPVWIEPDHARPRKQIPFATFLPAPIKVPTTTNVQPLGLTAALQVTANSLDKAIVGMYLEVIIRRHNK